MPRTCDQEVLKSTRNLHIKISKFIYCRNFVLIFFNATCKRVEAKSILFCQTSSDSVNLEDT